MTTTQSRKAKNQLSGYSGDGQALDSKSSRSAQQAGTSVTSVKVSIAFSSATVLFVSLNHAIAVKSPDDTYPGP
jgi:hypothetical protein